MKMRTLSRIFFFAVALIAMAVTVMHAERATAQSGLWFVVINLHGTPPTIGVAPGDWSSNGWLQQAGPYTTARQAWDVACRMHATERYFSPDIAEYKVAC